MTDEDRKVIVDVHNHYRGRVHVYNGGKRASNMLPMVNSLTSTNYVVGVMIGLY